ncbi:MAG TPA: trigger factor [Chthoniobacterales bacterium]|jgi:trigger factor
MNVEVESLPNCLASVKVEVPSETVLAAQSRIAAGYKNQARIPGYRPGKAPQAVIDKKFQKEIKEELTKQLVDEGFREAIQKEKLKVLSVSDVQDVEFHEDKSLSFTATVITQPVFELPEYKGLPVQVPSSELQPGDLDRALQNLREQHAEFVDLTDRGLGMGDFAVIDYTGTVDGKSVAEIAPKAGKALSGNTGFWIKMGPESFFKGFCDNLVGAKIDENRKFNVEIPTDFPAKDVAGLKIDFDVTVKGIKSQVLPELNDELAAKIIADHSYDQLVELLKEEIVTQRGNEAERVKRDQVVENLLSKVECELPEDMVQNETRRIMAEIVQQNQQRGISEEQLKESEKEIAIQAATGARNRLKGAFILTRIAEKEEIRINRNEVDSRVEQMAMKYRVTPKKMQTELQKRGGFGGLQEDILMGKVIDFLVANATVEEVAAPTPAE